VLPDIENWHKSLWEGTLEFKQLHYFRHVAELGSFSKAAAFLSIAQPALSRQIRNLEIELDVILLYRNGRGVTATEAGAVLLERSKAILEQCAKTVNEVSSIGGAVSGRVTLGLTPTVSQVLIRPLIAKLREEYPKISLEVVEGFSGHVNEWLVMGRLDIGLLNNAPRQKHLAAEDLLVEELLLVSPPVLGLKGIQQSTLMKVEKSPMILPSRPHGLRELVDHVTIKHGFTLDVTHEINSLSTIIDLVEDGAGSTMLPYAAVYREVTEGRLSAYRIKGRPFSQTVVLATPTHRPLSLAGHRVLDCIKQEVHLLHTDGKWLGSYQKT
jgi:LysR family nitrogen assimilation transcriptional regulator|tara:strand:- start:694 stop:1671 length:978 start_codon:yes stop_codon:yes gene_type:complete